MIYLIMGVSGSGKTTVGLKLASMIGANFLDADIYHSKINISKMKNGISLNDEDRIPWLLKLNSELIKVNLTGETTFLACSALKNSYREILLKNIENYLIIFLRADISLLKTRHMYRKNHFFNPILLASQMAILEEPCKKCITLDASKPIQFILDEIKSRI